MAKQTTKMSIVATGFCYEQIIVNSLTTRQALGLDQAGIIATKFCTSALRYWFCR